MHLSASSAFAALLLAAAARTATPPTPILATQQSGTTALLQAVSVVDARTVWVSGHGGTYARSSDGGATWQSGVVPQAETMQWRDLHAVSGLEAWLMSAGNGAASSIRATRDGGATWQTQFVNADSAAFYDCMAFWPGAKGFAFSDAVDAALPYLATSDGRTWQLSRQALPPAVAGEGGFAASGSCALTWGTQHGWIATGAGAVPRVHRTSDGGTEWQAVEVPLVRGGASGGAALAFRDARHGVVLGGSIDGKATGPRTAMTTDGGATWTTTGEPAFSGAIYGAAYTKSAGTWILLAVGPGGAAYSLNDGADWQPLAEGPFWSVGCADEDVCWLVGPKGRIVQAAWK